MDRKDFIKAAAMLPIGGSIMELTGLKNLTDGLPASPRYPVLFIGHGHPMNAIFDNDFTRTLAKIGTELPKPTAILVISAHWETAGTYVSTNPAPRTIYDFGGFDKKLYEVRYEPPGSPAAARQLIETVQHIQVGEDPSMGLDHGAWTVLKHMYPAADIPVFEMSIDYTKPPAFHYAFGQELKPLREKGVLILCSGNIVHNLRLLNWSSIDAPPTDWSVEFDAAVKTHIDHRQFDQLIHYEKMGTIARLSVPTNDHYLPMLYSLGLTGTDEPVRHIFEGYQYGSISMRCFQVG